jgi:hypothetical protein
VIPNVTPSSKHFRITLPIYGPREVNNLVGRRRLYSVLADFVMLTKLVTIINIYLNGTYGIFHVGKRLFDTCPNHNGLKERDVIWMFLFNSALAYAIRKRPRKPGSTGLK